MLSQGSIQLGMSQIKVIEQEQAFKQWERVKFLQRQRLNQGELSEKDKIKYGKQLKQPDQIAYLKEQILPKGFTSFSIDNFTKESNLKLYKCSQKFNPSEVNKRINSIFQVLSNQFSNPYQQKSLTQILRLKDLQVLVSTYQSENKQNYIPYFQEGIQFQSLQSWRFKHQQDQSSISYQQRDKLFQQLILLFKFISILIKKQHFLAFNITLADILFLRYQKINQFQCQFCIKLKLKWLFSIIQKANVKLIKQHEILQNCRRIIRKVVNIPDKKQKFNHIQKMHDDKIQYLVLFDDIIKLKYLDFYTNPKKFTPKVPDDSPSNQQQKAVQRNQEANNLKEMIAKLQQQAKKQYLNSKNINSEPRVKKMTQGENQRFWAYNFQYILKNVSESQRKSIIEAHQIKSNPQVVLAKKVQKAGSKPQSTPAKKQKLQHKKEQQIKLTVQKQTEFQVSVDALFIGSASGIRFRPQRLISLISNRQSILYVMNCRNKLSNSSSFVSFFTPAKLSKQHSTIFGEYCSDPLKRSYIYSDNKSRFYPLNDKNHAIGFGPQVFFVIGKLDLIIPCVGTQIIDNKQMIKCMSYYPVSYSQKGVHNGRFEIGDVEQQEGHSNKIQEKNGSSMENQIGLQKEFFVQEIDIYEIKLMAKPKA